MDTSLRFCGVAFRQADLFAKFSIQEEIKFINKQRGIMRKILDRNIRLMSQAYNKLL